MSVALLGYHWEEDKVTKSRRQGCEQGHTLQAGRGKCMDFQTHAGGLVFG
jgi:hypothetical protein